MLAVSDSAQEKSTVLLVDDEPLIRTLLAEQFRDAGFLVVEAASAEEALSYIDANGCPTALFSDVSMPGLLDGLWLAHEILSRASNTAVILASGDLALRKVPPGAQFLQKPFSLQTALQLTIKLIHVKNMEL